MPQKYQFRPGGLLRCCLRTLDEAMLVAEKPPEEGDTMRCAYHADFGGMIYRDGAWEWNKPKDLD